MLQNGHSVKQTLLVSVLASLHCRQGIRWAYKRASSQTFASLKSFSFEALTGYEPREGIFISIHHAALILKKFSNSHFQ